jgi:broad specificity polyphosphatase/5'/3'-nucleotidase SurE
MSWDDWDAYNDFVMAPESRSYWDRMASVCARVTATVLERGFPDCDVLNVNIPVDADATTPLVGSRVADTAYSAVFNSKGPGLYSHDYEGLSHIETADDTDIAALRRGEVALTPLRLHFGSMPGPDFDELFA